MIENRRCSGVPMHRLVRCLFNNFNILGQQMSNNNSEHNDERYFNIRISLGKSQGDPKVPFDPLPWLKLHIQMMEKKGLQPMYLPKLDNICGAVINTASFSLRKGLPQCPEI